MSRPESCPFRTDVLWRGLCFLLPVLLLLTAYALNGIFPFGEKTLLLVDMDNEYIDYFAHLHRTLRQGGGFFRAWEMGMGLNLMGLVAFYTASPLNLLVLLAPLRWLTEMVLALTLLKIGLCGLCFCHYARSVFPAVPRAAVAALSIAYALSGYTLAYSSNIMWLDGVAVLPLVLLGVERVVRRGRCGLLGFSLVYLFLTSYYIGYMAGGFSLLYLLAVCITRGGPLKEFYRTLGRYLLTALVAAGCCAFLLLPAFLELRDGQSALWDFPVSWSLKLTLGEVFAKLLPGSYDSLTDAGLPNLYSSVAGLLGAGLFLANRKIPAREKLAFGGLGLFLLLSLSAEILNLAWHAFEVPTWFPARYSFVCTFLLLYLALRALSAPEGIGAPGLWVTTGVLLLLVVETGARRLEFITTRMLLAAAALLLLYALLFLTWRRPGRFRPLLAGLLVLLVLLETGWHSYAMVRGMDDQFHYRDREAYLGFRERLAPAVEAAHALDGGVSRTELLQPRNANGGLALGYRGVSHYSTTTDQELNALMRRLGYNTGTINELRFAPTTSFQTGLFGVRWILSDTDPGAGYRLRQTVGEVGVFENNYALPLAYWADEAALAFNHLERDPFRWQNGLAAALDSGAGPVYTSLVLAEERLENLEKTQEEPYLVYQRVNSALPAAVEYRLENRGGEPAYAFLPVYNRRFTRATAFVNGQEWGRELSYRNNTILSLGAGEQLLLRLEFDSDRVQIDSLYFYAMDPEAAARVAQTANSNAVIFTRFENSRVEGRVSAPDAGVLVTSIPYDRGWTVRVDGERVPTHRFAGAFLAVPLTPGDHALVLRYLPPGFAVGSGVTCLSLLCGVLLLLRARRRV